MDLLARSVSVILALGLSIGCASDGMGATPDIELVAASFNIRFDSVDENSSVEPNGWRA